MQKHQYPPSVIRDRTVTAVTVLFRTLFIIGLSYLFLFPLFYMLSVSVQSPDTANDPAVVWIPKSICMDSIRSVVEEMQYFRSAGLTLLISVCSSLGTLLSCGLVAYGLSRFEFVGKRLIFALVVLTIIVPPQTTLVSQYLNFRFFNLGGLLSFVNDGGGLNLLNTPWTMILPSLFASGLRAGLFVFIFRQFFTDLPKDLEEAAFIDGCGTLRTFFSIIVPLSVPAVVTVLLFSFVWHWNDLYSSSMFFSGEIRPLTPILNGLQAQMQLVITQSASSLSHYQMRSYMASGALLTVLPPLLLYIFTQKYFVESTVRTGIVG